MKKLVFALFTITVVSGCSLGGLSEEAAKNTVTGVTNNVKLQGPFNSTIIGVERWQSGLVEEDPNKKYIIADVRCRSTTYKEPDDVIFRTKFIFNKIDGNWVLNSAERERDNERQSWKYYNKWMNDLYAKVQ